MPLLPDIQSLQKQFGPLGISCGYWSKRGVPDEWIKRYRLGFDERRKYATIPFYEGNRLAGIVGRSTTSDDVNSKFISYGFNRRNSLYFPQGIAPEENANILLVEGSLDAIKCRQLGVKNVAAIYCLVPNQAQRNFLEVFKPKKLTLLLDSDQWGRRAKDTLLAELYPFFAEVEVIYCPQDGADPWEYAKLGEFLTEQNLITAKISRAAQFEPQNRMGYSVE